MWIDTLNMRDDAVERELDALIVLLLDNKNALRRARQNGRKRGCWMLLVRAQAGRHRGAECSRNQPPSSVG